jgi:hypothetical protein
MIIQRVRGLSIAPIGGSNFMSFTRRCAVAAALALAVVAPAAAQNFDADPNYGTVELHTGFTPDPHVVAVRSGGEINAQTVSGSCQGFISDAPDVRLVFEAGSSLPLIISVAAAADTTLVVNAPDGRWYCDDDSGTTGLNPMVRFNNPQSGRYEIWVGTYGNASLQPAQLNISELYSQ